MTVVIEKDRCRNVRSRASLIHRLSTASTAWSGRAESHRGSVRTMECNRGSPAKPRSQCQDPGSNNDETPIPIRPAPKKPGNGHRKSLQDVFAGQSGMSNIENTF